MEQNFTAAVVRARPAHSVASDIILGLGFLVLGSLLTIAIVKSVPHIYRYWRLRHIPAHTSSRGYWLLGNLVDMIKPNHHLFLREAALAKGGIFRTRILWMQMVVVTDARFVNVILGPTEGLNKGMEPDNADRLISVNGHRSLFSSDTNSKYWRLIRKGTTGAFQFKNIRSGFPGVLRMALQIVDNIKRLGPEADLDINNITMRYSMDVTGLVGFAKDFGTCRSFDDADTDELFDILRAAMLEVYRGAINPVRRLCFFLPEVRNSAKLFKSFRQHMRELLLEVKARGPPPPEDISIAAHLLRLRNPDTGEPLSDDLMTGEFGVYFTAGIESAGNAMSWTLFLIGQRPDVEAKICAELDAIGLLATPERVSPRPMELNDLNKLPYFVNVCKETMRMKPVASTGSTRLTKRDVILGGYTIPANTLVICPFDAVHHSPINWEDPDQFKPERWEVPGAEFIPGTGKGGTNEGGIKRYLAFSTGPRQCIGQPLAHMMHDVGVAVLLSHFTFRLAPKMGGPEGVLATEINRLTLQPGIGLWMNAIPRASLVPCKVGTTVGAASKFEPRRDPVKTSGLPKQATAGGGTVSLG